MTLPAAYPPQIAGFHLGDAVVVTRRDSSGRPVGEHFGRVVGLNARTRRISVESPTFKKRKRRAFALDACNIELLRP